MANVDLHIESLDYTKKHQKLFMAKESLLLGSNAIFNEVVNKSSINHGLYGLNSEIYSSAMDYWSLLKVQKCSAKK